ncbi:Uncharacterized protein TCAP_00361 [Tolypocladium capitatum]|uniref:Uncharacterized protein n=1 Tax=Tolypocladium capitatum TaxID=45235 RepID=A0A2K3QQB9_9HYPO|nr:Uncharacterized protein TCAP_00361 [Tolypocladium capitatum]
MASGSPTPTPASSSTRTASPPVITSFASNPLTTTFSRPADCTGLYQSLFLTMMDVQSTCLPTGFNTKPDAFFSPGVACPSGYVSACHDNTGVASQTTVTCCPTFNSDITLSCAPPGPRSGIWSTLFCTWMPAPSQDTTLPVTTSSNGITSTEMRDFPSPAGINAFGVRMVYQRTDLTSATTSATDSTSSADPQSTSGSASSSGLSTGARAAIGVVVPLVVLAILAGALLWWRRRRRLRAPGGPLEDGKTQPPGHAELHGEHVQEMMGTAVDEAGPAELAEPVAPVEPVAHEPVELPAMEEHR